MSIGADKIKYIKKIILSKTSEKAKEISLLERGACSNIYLIKSNRGNLYCLKEQRHDKLDNERNNLSTEGKIIKLLNKKNIKWVPRILFISHNLICYKFKKGVSLDLKWNLLSENEKKTIMFEIGKYHGELFSKITLGGAENLGLKKAKDNFKSMLKLSNVNGNHYLFNKIKRFEKKFSHSNKGLISFLHGDLHKGNLLIYKRKLNGIVDFGKSVIGDIHMDFSHHARHFPKYIDYAISGFNDVTQIKLSKNKIFYYALLKDLEKLIYHIDKVKLHKENLEKKIRTTYNILE